MSNSQQRPLLSGPVQTGSHIEFWDTEWPTNRDWRRRGGRIFTRDYDLSNSEFTSGASGPTATQTFTLAVGDFPVGSLKKGGISRWDIVSNYFNINGLSQDVKWELVVDDVPPANSALIWNQNQVADPASIMVFSAALRIVGDTYGLTRHLVTANLLVVDGAGNELLSQTKHFQPVINPDVPHEIGWSVQKVQANAGTRLEVQSILGWQEIQTDGRDE